MNIDPIQSSLIQGINRKVTETKTENAAQELEQTFADALTELSETQETSDNLIQQLATGEDVDIHQVLIAAEETDINFRIAVAIRDKLVDAYREIRNMSV
ncbi:MAG: flagellar hook-basal body complex protein FliE [Anaerolineales bacterium]|nr:flagellar hook-basal body complex protein FliE [Anaerolineales bacterium]